jgi:uncharacterized membrane protein
MNDQPSYGWDDPRHWHGGLLGLYVNPGDPRIWVPKRRPGFGWTLNFAHAKARWVFASLMGGIALLALLPGLLHKN